MIEGGLRLVRAVMQQRRFRDVEPGGDLRDRLHSGGMRDFDIAFRHCSVLPVVLRLSIDREPTALHTPDEPFSPRFRFSYRQRGLVWRARSEEHTSELQSLMRISYAFSALTNKKQTYTTHIITS